METPLIRFRGRTENLVALLVRQVAGPRPRRQAATKNGARVVVPSCCERPTCCAIDGVRGSRGPQKVRGERAETAGPGGRSRMLTLLVEGLGSRSFSASEVTVGRAATCDLRIDDDAVSGRHLAI